MDELKFPNYDDINLRLEQEDMNDAKRKAYLYKIIKKAKTERYKIPGYKTAITKNLNKGLMGQAEAQFKRKLYDDEMKLLNDYIRYNTQKLKTIKGSGLKKKIKRGGQVQFFNNPTEMIKKLELIIGSMIAGNNSIELRNTGVALLDILLKNSILNRPQYNKIYKNYFNVN